MNTIYTLVQTEESFEQFHGCGIQDAVKVCESIEEVNRFAFEVIHKRLVETYEREFHLGELLELGMSKEMSEAFGKMSFTKKLCLEDGEVEYPSLASDFEIAEKAGWMDISLQDILLFLNEDVDERITWHIIQGAPIVGKPRPARKAERDISSDEEQKRCTDCGDEIESECFGCFMTNVQTGETKIVCDGCVEELDESLWREG